MRLLFSFLLFTLAFTVSAQKSMFVRVYDLSGNKIHKGKVVSATETSLQLKGVKEDIIIPVSGIGKIKTKRSAGNNILYGAIAGGLALGIYGATTSEPGSGLFDYSSSEGFFGGLLLGAAPGAAAGGITAIFKKPVTYKIDGNLDNWKVFQSAMNDVNKLKP